MEYQTIQPPFVSLAFHKMSKTELKRYYAWFMEVLPERLRVLAKAVRCTPDYRRWRPDYSPASLDGLEKWFRAHVETRQRSPEELECLRSTAKYPRDIRDTDLTPRTYSLAMDIAMYLSQVFLENHPSLRWGQRLTGVRTADYGQPVLVEFVGGVPVNPVWMVVMQARGFASSVQPAGRLRWLYETWAALVSPHPE